MFTTSLHFFNAQSDRAPKNLALARYDDVARLLTGNSHAAAPDGLAWLRELVNTLKIPPLRSYGLKREEIPEVVAAAQKASSMNANPIVLTPEELTSVLLSAT